MAAPTINFLSYNPTGFDNVLKAQWTREIICTFNISFVSIQEHFKKNVGNMFDKQFPDFQNYVIPGSQGFEICYTFRDNKQTVFAEIVLYLNNPFGI